MTPLHASDAKMLQELASEACAVISLSHETTSFLELVEIENYNFDRQQFVSRYGHAKLELSDLLLDSRDVKRGRRRVECQPNLIEHVLPCGIQKTRFLKEGVPGGLRVLDG